MADSNYPSPSSVTKTKTTIFTEIKTVAYPFSFASVLFICFTTLSMLSSSSYSPPWRHNIFVTLPSSSSSSSSSGGENGKEINEAHHEKLRECSLFDGKWVRDDSYPLYSAGSCPHIHKSFDCFRNGRPDRDYEKYRWQPNGCVLPRLNGKHMLELLRGKRVAFIGDSLAKNMWNSLVCILRNSVENNKSNNVFKASGGDRLIRRGNSILFQDYNCSIERFRSPFLVQEQQNGSKKRTLRLDLMDESSNLYKNADILIFNSGHWWVDGKTSKGIGFYQEGSTIYDKLDVDVAFRKALTTWARWIDTNIDSKKTIVFFKGLSATHFRGGRWNSGGHCDSDPISNNGKYLNEHNPRIRIPESVMNDMTTPVVYLNISGMTSFRNDAHPSIYRKKNLTKEEIRIQDCGHWCLPGVPDTWNELLYAQLLVKHND